MLAGAPNDKPLRRSGGAKSESKDNLDNFPAIV